MREKAPDRLALILKTSWVQIAYTDSGAAARSVSPKLLILASDASDNAKGRAKGFVYGKGIPLITVPFLKEEISAHVGKSGCSMAAVCDLGFADSFLKLLQQISPGLYDETAQTIAAELIREKQRRSERAAHEKNKRIGKRRNNA